MPREVKDKSKSLVSKRKRSSSRKRRRTIQRFTFFNELETNTTKHAQKGIKYPIISRLYDAKRFRVSNVVTKLHIYCINSSYYYY